jgi:hypothetical protein
MTTAATQRRRFCCQSPPSLLRLSIECLQASNVAHGDANRVVAFFRGFQAVAQSSTYTNTASGRTRSAASGKPVYSREQIAALYEQHRKGAYVGREAEWAKLEYDICRASGEGRITNPITDLHGK